MRIFFVFFEIAVKRSQYTSHLLLFYFMYFIFVIVNFLFRISQQPKADAWVREIPGAAGQNDEDAGRLRQAAAGDGWEQRKGFGRTDGILRNQTPRYDH